MRQNYLKTFYSSRIRFYLLLILFLIFSSCNSLKVDTSTEESTTKSIQKIKNSLNDDDKKEFEDALKFIMFNQVELDDILAGTPQLTKQKMLDELHGKTANQIITEANLLKAKQESEELKEALVEIEKLESLKDSCEKAKNKLKSFVVHKSKFYKEKRRFRGPQPVIDLTVENKTKFPISKACFRGTIYSPERAIPWLIEDFCYSISGGIESNEKQSWSLIPSMFADWDKVSPPTTALFDVEVLKLYGPDGNILISSEIFDSTDAQKLIELKNDYNIK